MNITYKKSYDISSIGYPPKEKKSHNEYHASS